ncbi:DUF6602 domain-containing protein [Rufibacter sp. LB8]|uniref:DUF6602 domain-containing protein n=1 Tax=Rufibacter sp. LB8 TaxID=2777781 RepID=UPI00178C41BF|nr:DUF6602 domain-containing protein [Rufibacter sp. LB8]
MSNKIQQAIILEKINYLKLAFNEVATSVFWDEKTKSLKHPGEYGMYREVIIKEFLKSVVPQKLSIGNGFVINSNEEVSTQCDIIIYDKDSTPLIEDSERQKFFPVETIIALGEVKSNLSKVQLKVALNKLARTKKLREHITEPSTIRKIVDGDFDPINCPYDNIFSFIICKKLDFDLKNIANEIDTLYESDIMPWQKHNLILSLDDGLITYILQVGEKDRVFSYPYVKGQSNHASFVTNNTNNDAHILLFSTMMFGNTSSISTYLPDLQCYLSYQLDYNYVKKGKE